MLTVVGLVIALVIVNSSKQDTVVAPLPSLPEPTSTDADADDDAADAHPRLPPPDTAERRRLRPARPDPLRRARPKPWCTTSSGDGRAINITYVDTGGVLQTEFNVMLPWSKEVELAQPAEDSASVSIINVGREVSCSITVNGVQVQQRTGAGLTICTANRLDRRRPAWHPHGKHRDETRRQHQQYAPDARAVGPEDGDERGEHERREGRHGAARHGVEPERHPLLAVGGHPQQQRARRRLRRPDEQAQQQPAHPERHGAGQRHQGQAHDDHRGQRAQDDGLRADAVVEQPAEHRPGRGHHVGG